MKFKLYWFFVSIAVSLLLVVNILLPVNAVAFSQDNPENGMSTDLAEEVTEIPTDEQDLQPEFSILEDVSEDVVTFLDPPYLSEDGTTVFNAELPRVLLVDPNPEMQNLRFPRDPEVEAAIAGTRAARAAFSITYLSSGTKDAFGYTCSTFPEAAKSAFNTAAAIWAAHVQSSVPITINACWTNGLPPGVLGGSGSRVWHRNFPGAPQPNTWYQAALANSLAGYDLDPTPTEPDMHITFSSAFSWYYGTNGLTPSGTYDLVTVAAHEIGHGLHFAGTVRYSSGFAWYGWDTGYPSIYETFMESSGGTKLTSYPNDSTALGTLVTSNNLWWNGTHANAANVANGGGRVKMYAPSTWSPGSSYSHLDYTTFRNTINSLMVYAIGQGSSQHNPGPVTLGMFKDMGWQVTVPGPQLLTIEKVGSGAGTVTSTPAGIQCGVTCSTMFDFGTTVTLSAEPMGDSTFAGWSGSGCSGTGTCQVKMIQARSVTAYFRIPGEEIYFYLPLIISTGSQ